MISIFLLFLFSIISLIFVFVFLTDTNQSMDTNHTIPEHHRDPGVSIHEFNKIKQQASIDAMLKTRLTFKEQPYFGSVMRDGFHADLPENAMWKDGIVAVGPEIQSMVAKAKQVSQPQPQQIKPK